MCVIFCCVCVCVCVVEGALRVCCPCCLSAFVCPFSPLCRECNDCFCVMPSHNAVFAVDSVLCVFRSVVC